MDTTEQDTQGPLREHLLTAADVDAPLALCSDKGVLQSATPAAWRLLERFGIVEQIPAALPTSLWSTLEAAQVGESVEWQPPWAADDVLGCTRYVVRHAGFLLLMREVSDKHRALTDILNRRHLECTGRLAASVAHDVRSSVASIVYSADFLEMQGPGVRSETFRDTVREICDASRRLQLTVDGLLDYARLGPAIAVPVALREVLSRAHGTVRKLDRSSLRTLRVELGSLEPWLRGNPVVIEQIVVNLLLVLIEGRAAPVVHVSLLEEAPVLRGQDGNLQICLSEEGQAGRADEEVRVAAFAARSASNALLVSDARAATESQGGTLQVGNTERGLSFVLRLPRSEGPR